MSKAAYCGQCGVAHASGDKFCQACGTKRGKTNPATLAGFSAGSSAGSASSGRQSYDHDGGCHCDKCGASMVPASSGRGDTYCGCEDAARTPEEREAYDRWIQGMERR